MVEPPPSPYRRRRPAPAEYEEVYYRSHGAPEAA